MTMTRFPAKNMPEIPVFQRVIALLLVVVVHGIVLFIWVMSSERGSSDAKPMPVYVSLETKLPQAQSSRMIDNHQATLTSKTQSLEVVVTKVASLPPLATISAVTSPPVTVAITATVVADETRVANEVNAKVASSIDSAPNYQAAYLSNPPPSYPMVARRMGWQGKVVLNVEVLSRGVPGEISIFRSSNYSVLDQAAINAVKQWQFVPAQRDGRVITQWFQVPISFLVRESPVQLNSS